MINKNAIAINDFNEMRLKAYQKLSLKQPLTDGQFKEYKSLAKELYNIGN